MSAPATRIRATILGCGSSGGVPRIGNNWGACDPFEPKNRRRRCALLIEGTQEGASRPTRILIDTGCDIREQLLDAGVDAVDAVFYTHDHADHVHGIDDLRVFALNAKRRLDVYCSSETAVRLRQGFGYCFEAPPGSGYPPILNMHLIEPGQTTQVVGPGGSLDLTCFAQVHGDIMSLGYRIAGFAYSCDISGVPEQSMPFVYGLDVWVVDALRHAPHFSHFGLSQAVEWIERVGARRGVLTHMHIELDYAKTKAETPDHVEPAYDGMVIPVLGDPDWS